MSTDGKLEYQGTKRVLYRGDTSNIVFDTRTTSLGIGVTGSNNPSSNLYITGNAYVSSNLEIGGVMTMGVVNVAARHNLQAITAIGNVTTQTVQFDNPTTAFTTTGNVSDLNIVSNVNMLHTANTAAIKLDSNVVTEFPRSKKLIKYPRVAMTQNDESATSGYVAGRSSIYAPHEAWYMFDEDSTTFWHSGNSTGYWNSNGTYDGTSELVTGYPGEYVTLQLPTNEKVQLHGIRVFPRGLRGQNSGWSAGAAPKEVVVVGSNNGSSWNVIATTTLTNYSFGSSPSTSTPVGEEYIPATFDFEATEYYQYVGLIIESIYPGGHVHASMTALEFLGLPEYDPEAHGTDVVVKSVPNVPNTDFLDVFVDAGNTSGYSLSGSSVNSVTDLSSPANTMSVTGVTYDSTNKAFVFSGSSSSYIKATLANGNGNYAHTLSVWFMMTDYSNSWRSIMGLGSNGTNQQSAIAYDPNQDQLYFGTYGADVYVPHKPQLYKWYHVAATFSGGSTTSTSMNIYLNGVNMGGAPDGTQTPQFTGNQLCIGGTMNTGGTQANNPFKGQIANARFYRREYSPDEIYQLYAHQKEDFGGDLSMTLKAGRLGIGTSEPRAALDVRGDVRGGCPVYFQAELTTNNFAAAEYNSATSGAVIIWDKLYENTGCYNPATGLFTAPMTAVYKFGYSMRSSNASLSDYWTYIQKNGVVTNSRSDTPGRIYSPNDYNTNFSSFIMDLRAGDTVGILLATGNNGSATISNSYGYFHGHYFSESRGQHYFWD